MSSARAFLHAQQRSVLRASLDAALLTDRGARYVSTRIGLPGVRAIVRSAIHVAEVSLLAREFPFEFLAPLFALRTLPALLGGVHWGALEALRARVRREARHPQGQAASATVTAYLTATGIACALLASAVIGLVAHADDPLEGALGLYGLFAIVTACTTALDLWMRTYHAGVFALGRVYRPTWSFFGPDLLELGTLFLLWPSLGPFALHATVLAGGITRSTLAIAFAARGYRAHGLARPRVFAFRTLRRLTTRDALDGARHAAAVIPLQLDRFLLLALLHAPPPSEAALALAAPYYALRPIAGFSQAWARTFYPDFVRLDAAGVGVLRARFERLLARTSLVAGMLAALVLALGASLLFGARGAAASLVLAPLVLVRSRFALEQARGFAYGAHRSLAITGGVLLAGLGLASNVHVSDRVLAVLVTLVMLAALLLVPRIASHARERRQALTRRLPFSAFLHRVSTDRKPVQLWVARVDSRIASSAAMLRTIAHALDSRGHVARIGRAHLVFCEPAEHGRPLGAWVRTLAGGAAELHHTSGIDGAHAIEHALRAGFFPREVTQRLCAAPEPDPRAALLQRAAELVPGAVVLDLHASGAALRDLPQQQLALIRRAVLAAAREQHHLQRRAPWQVAVYAPRGEPELVLVWPSGAARGGELRQAALHASYRASLTASTCASGAAPTAPPPPARSARETASTTHT